MSRTFVTLAEVLETRGGPLLEDEVWSLLLGTTESLVDVSYKGHNSMCSIISPSSLLLSGTGTLAFKNCALSDEACNFTAPEMLRGCASSTKDVMEKMLVYSLGMTLYWSVNYHLPQNQPVQLSDHLNGLLVSMCEDLAHRRVNLNSILESCESQHKASLLPPPNRVIRQLVEDVFNEVVDHVSEPFVPLCGRSQMIRERVNGKHDRYPDYSEGCAAGAGSRQYSNNSGTKSESLLHKPWRQKPRSSPTPAYPPNIDRLPQDLRHMESSSSPYIGAPSKGAPQPHSPFIIFSDSSASLTERKVKVCSSSTSICSLRAGKQLVVELKKANGSLGISVAGGVNTSVHDGGIYIESLVPRGAAEQDGRIQIGDRLLEVDGSNLRGVTQKQAVECLKRTGEVVRLLLEKELQVASQSQSGSLRRDSSMEMTLSGKDYSFVTDDNTLDVRLKKSLCGLGFSFYISELNSGSDQGSSVVHIKTLFQGQPAQESGQIREGDIILTVNGRWVSGLSYQRVLFLLSGTLSEVHLTLCRPVPGVPSQLDADTLVPFSYPTSGVRSRSLDIRLGEDYSQLLKLQSHQIHQNHQYNKENQAQKGPMKSSYAQEQASGQESQDSEMKAAEKQPSSLSPTPPSPPSPISLASRSDPADHEELSVVDEEVSKEISLASGGSKTSVSPMYTSLSSQTTSSTNPNLSSKTTSVQQTRSQPFSRPPSSLSSRMSDLNISHSVHQPQPAIPPLPSLSSHTANPNSRTSDRKHSITFKTTNASNLTSTVIQYHPQPPDTFPLSQPPTHHPSPQPPPFSLSPPIQPAPLPCTCTSWRQETEGEEDENDDEDPRKGMMKEFEMCVVLTKLWRGGFGFTITRSKLDACYYIQDILDNPAKTDGRLRPGDRLVTVNGQDVTNVTDEVAMSILRSSPRRLSMTLGRAVTNLIAPPSPDNLQDIILHKTPTGQLGIKLTGGIGSKRQGIYCLEVVPGSPASEEGSVQPNDRILYICGRCTMGMTLEDAVKACENAPRKVKLKATRNDQPVTPKAKRNGLSDLREWKKEKEWKYFTHFEEPVSPEPETPTEQAKAVTETTGKFRSRLSVTSDQDSCILKIDVCKPEGGWLGFALIGGCNGSVLRVKKICTGGVAHQDGRLRVGDILLEVNGIIVSGLSHSKVVDILRKVKGNVQLNICRDIIRRANTAPCTDGFFYMASCPRDNMAACPGSNTASCPGSGSNMASCTGSNMASCPGSNISPCPGSNMMTCQGVNMGDKAELVSKPAACFLPDVQQEDLPPELTSDPVPYVEEDAPHSPPQPSPPHHPAHRLQALTEGMAGQESCTSIPSHPACCLSSKSVANLLHEASDRNQISVTTLGEPITGSKNSQSDGWSSVDEDDGAFEANGQEAMSPSSGPPIVSEEELASLAMISPAKTSQYSGPRVKALIQILQHQLDQQELVREFMALEHLQPFDNLLVGKAPENREKNLYRDILPYDKARVLVGDNQDYINASYIRMEVGSEELFYISCQGPLPSTVPDFWQMVWENRSDVIAMMTQDVERGRVKCHRYWPKKVSCPLDTGPFHLSLENQQIQEYFHIKIIRMVEKESGKTHFVHHLKFTRWPDHGVPQCSEQLVRFIRYLRAVHHKGPVTVHCSAGIGQTGVLICTDVILSLIEYDLPIKVSSIVREMRLQRYGMIQTKEQYLFCYKLWLEVLQGILQLHGNRWHPESPRKLQPESPPQTYGPSQTQ